MKKKELLSLIEKIVGNKLNRLREEDESWKIKVGDKVYWRIRMGYKPLTISGVVEKIEGDIATVRQTTQNTSGKRVKKSLGSLTKKLKQ